MFSLPGTIGLIVFIYIRPQEFIESLQLVPFLYIFLALSVFGLALDLRLRVSRPTIQPMLLPSILFVMWAAATVFLKAPDRAMPALIEFAVPVIVYIVLAQGVQTFKGLRLIAGTLLAIALFLAVVCVHQGFSAKGCVLLDPEGTGDLQIMQPDGRPCDNREQCFSGSGAVPGGYYICENVGLFGTNSVAGGRVRYRGILQDPNELALALASVLPFAFAFFARKKSLVRLYLMMFSMLSISTLVIMTKSRGGILVFLAAVGIYVLKRYKGRGVVLGMVMALPILLLGGRSGSEASQSADERFEAWKTGFELFRSDPIFGVGFGQFLEYHYLTAHNSYILVMAEMGLLGFLLWSSLLYISTKILVLAHFRYQGQRPGKPATDWSLGLIAMIASTLVGITFLSMSYHLMLWIYFGLCAGFWQCVKTHDPRFTVKFGPIDAAAVFGLCSIFIVMLFGYIRLKGG